MLKPVTKRLPDIQRDLQQLLHADTVLVGHSLENDLQALRLAHPHVLDTSVLYGNPKVPTWRPSLRELAHRYLHRSIQGYGTSYRPKGAKPKGGRPTQGPGPRKARGHDSAEDAKACLDLTLLKVANGPEFGRDMGDKQSLLSLAKARGYAVSCAGSAPVLQVPPPPHHDPGAALEGEGAEGTLQARLQQQVLAVGERSQLPCWRLQNG